uniref:Barttin n=1 Tax=Kryptolebias marmoratus TaxID=37003 RepID=A0A3Q3A3E1_KRYMA
MVEGKPYRYGLIVAGLCVGAVGLFVMMQERPHVYVTACFLGATMVCVGTVWSLCQCYPKVESESVTDGAWEVDLLTESVCLLGHCDSQSHSCPTLHLV